MNTLLALTFVLSSQNLTPCEDFRSAYCMTLDVPENPEQPKARQISVKVMVAKSTSRNKKEDPIFFLAGGPGQSATSVAPHIVGLFRELRQSRDIVFVDQRGTGDSNGLECESESNTLADALRVEFDFEALEKCRKSYDADLRFYTSLYAANDLDAVRKTLGYKTINLFGVSYGTRMAMVYAQEFPENTRALILDGNAPIDIKLPLHSGEDAKRALSLLERDFGEALDLSSLNLPQTVKVAHPLTGVYEEVTFSEQNVAAIIRGTLSSTTMSALIPLAMRRAKEGDFRALAGLALGDEGGISLGMFLAVVCNEDIPQITDDDLTKIDGVFLTKDTVRSLQKVCAAWPKAKAHSKKAISARALVLSGELDPVTPERWAKIVQKRIERSTLVTVPQSGHGTWTKKCARDMMRDFLDDKALDNSCLKNIKREPFFKNELGP